ncbi:MAG: MbnP family copper-binding protein [Myxococcota bacterium]
MRLILPVFAFVLTACPQDDDSGTDSQHSHSHEVVLSFAANVGDLAAACGTDYTVGSADNAVQLADARLMLSNIQLRNTEGGWDNLELDESAWQHDSIALLDFEDGTAACADSGTSQLNDQIIGQIAHGNHDKVRFDVGVPFAFNHLDSATAPAPLNTPGMFWAWQSGYKFLRVDFAVAGEASSRWNVHIGSTGCVSDAPTAAPEDPCSRPARATIEVDLPPTGELTLDLASLVSAVDLSANSAETPPGCMSSPTEPADCTGTYGALGMSFDTAECVDDCAGQTLFTEAGD